MTSKKRSYTNVCRVCGITFFPFFRLQPTCSRKCGLTLAGLSRRRRTTKTCRVCRKSFEVKSHRTNARYCSRECWSHRAIPVIHLCRGCGISFANQDKRTVFCSPACKRKYMVGPNAPRWKDGKSLERERGRLSAQLATWRKEVFARDNYVCVRCGRAGRVHAHHIKPWADFPFLRLDVTNGETLCEQCHGKEHNKDFTNHRNKTCPSCSVQTQGKGVGGLCRSCASKRAHRLHGRNPDHPCQQCGTPVTRSGRIFCSISCGAKHHHASLGHKPRTLHLSKTTLV